MLARYLSNILPAITVCYMQRLCGAWCHGHRNDGLCRDCMTTARRARGTNDPRTETKERHWSSRGGREDDPHIKQILAARSYESKFMTERHLRHQLLSPADLRKQKPWSTVAHVEDKLSAIRAVVFPTVISHRMYLYVGRFQWISAVFEQWLKWGCKETDNVKCGILAYTFFADVSQERKEGHWAFVGQCLRIEAGFRDKDVCGMLSDLTATETAPFVRKVVTALDSIWTMAEMAINVPQRDINVRELDIWQQKRVLILRVSYIGVASCWR